MDEPDAHEETEDGKATDRRLEEAGCAAASSVGSSQFLHRGTEKRQEGTETGGGDLEEARFLQILCVLRLFLCASVVIRREAALARMQHLVRRPV